MSNLACGINPGGSQQIGKPLDKSELVDIFDFNAEFFVSKLYPMSLSDLIGKLQLVMRCIFYQFMLMLKITKTVLIILITNFVLVITNQVEIGYSISQQNSNRTCTIPLVISQGVIELGNCQNQVYIMPLNIGTPEQSLYYALETAQNFVWVVLKQVNQTGFKLDDSSTVQISDEEVEIQFQDGQTALAFKGSDIITINDSNINIRSLMYFVDQEIPNNYPQYVSGAVGLGISSHHKNIFQLAEKNGEIGSSTFAIDLNLANESSYLYYNGIPESISSGSINMDSFSDKYFSLEIIGLYANDIEYTSGTPSQAIISSGVSYFYLNQKLYQAIIGNFFSSCVQNNLGMSCSCDLSNWPTFTFMFSKAEAYIQPQNYVVQLGDGTCSYGFGYVENSKNKIVLGTSFFLGYNVTFNKQKKKIALQGNLSPIQVINYTFFIVSQYILLAIIILLSSFSAYLAWHIRIIQKNKGSRLIQFGISNRFIETD